MELRQKSRTRYEIGGRVSPCGAAGRWKKGLVFHFQLHVHFSDPVLGRSGGDERLCVRNKKQSREAAME